MISDTLLYKFQQGIRGCLRSARVEEGTKRAVEVEYHFLTGAVWANPEVIDNPTLLKYYREGRSILTLDLET